MKTRTTCSLVTLFCSLIAANSTLAGTAAPSNPGESQRAGVRVETPTSGTGLRGTAILNVDTSQTFATIQDAIDDPNTLAGHTLEVQAVSHSEGIVTVTKSLTLRGATGTEVVTATTNTGSSGDARGWFLVETGVVLDVENLTFDGDSGGGRQVYQAFRIKGSGSFDNCTFQNIRYTTYVGVAVVPFGDGPVNISNCTFSNIEREGVLYFGSGVNGSVYSNNTYTGQGPGDHLDYGVEVGGGASATIQDSTITDCVGVASSDGSTSAGVLATTYFGAGTTATVTGNFLNGNTTGVFVGYDSADTTSATVSNNDLSGNDSSGLENTSATETTDASGNWWGANDAATVATSSIGTVDYTPWLDVSTDVGGDPSDGFDGDFSTLDVDDDSPQSGGAGRINEAIGLVSGSTINVAPGTYGPFSVNTTVNLLGAQSGVDARGRVAGAPNPAVESVITGAGILCTLVGGSAGSVIDGFAFSGGTRGMESSSGPLDGIQVLNNHFSGATGPELFINDSGTDLTFDQNEIDASAGSSTAFHLDQDSFPGLNITNNNILNSNGTGLFVDGNHNVSPSGSRDPLIEGNLFDNNETGANLGRFAFTGGDIRLNTFSNSGFDGLQGGIQSTLITQNSFTDNGRYGIALTGFGGSGDPTRGAQNSTITENSFSGNVTNDLIFSSTQFPGTIGTNSASNNSFGSAAAVSYAGDGTGDIIDLSANWWGSDTGPTVSNHPTGTGNSISGAASGDIDFTPWLDAGTDVGGDPSDGFQGDFSTLNVDDDSPQYGSTGRVQEGVDLVTASTVNVLPGTYEEQVVIMMDNLQLLGAGSGTNPLVDSIIESPVSLAYSFNSGSNDNYPVIGVEGAIGVNIDGLRIDGLGRGNSNYRFVGIAFWNAGGSVNDCSITEIRDTPFSGAQHGVGVYANNDSGGPFTLDVSYVTVDDYQKNGMALSGTGLTTNVSNCTTVGAGATTVTAQNGIQIGFGAGGTVDNCDVSDNLYTVGTYASTGLLLYSATNVDVTDTTATDNFPGVWFLDTNGSFDNGTVSNLSPDSVDGFYVYNDTPALRGGESRIPVPAQFDDATAGTATATSAPISVTVTNSTFVGHDGAGTWGITAYASGTGSANLTVSTSTIRNWDYGLVAYDYGGPTTLTANLNQIYNNVSYGYYSYLTSVQDAEYNYWGDPSGPEDLLGTDEAENPPCFDPLTMVNANGLGNGVTDENVDYCPWLGGPATLTLNPGSECVTTVGDTLTVTIDATFLTTNIVGGQFFLSYDNSVLDFVSAVSGDALFTELYESVDEIGGTIDYAVNAPSGDPGTNADVSMAVLTFNTLVEVCDAADLVTFRTHAPPTRLSDFGGGEVSPALVDLSAVSIDETIPVISGLTVTGGDVDSNCEKTVTISATVTDNCCVLASDVSVNVALTTGNATLGTPNITKMQTDGQTVTITGDVLVSDLTSCPATVEVTIDALDCCGNAAVQAIDSDDVNDNTDPVITCPADITVNADAGVCTASGIDPGFASATDNCDPAPMITWVRSDGAGSLTDPYDSADSPITITWTATDACGNMDQCVQTITVNAFNDLVVDVQLSPNIDTDNALPDTLTRCITFELWDCGGPSSVTVSAEVDFTVTAGAPNTAIGTATIDVPCGFYDCITARDTLHTLRRTDETFGIVGTQYVADFTGNAGSGGDWLIGGNLNDDFYIDILDFGTFSAQFATSFGTGDTTCSMFSPHSDISGDGDVDSFDFSFIQVNFLLANEPNCCGAPALRGDGEGSRGPITEISVQELRQMGLGNLAVGDLNGDGLLNADDMAAFANGARPRPTHRPVKSEERLRD